MSNVLNELDNASKRDDIPSFRPGDTVKVHVKVVEGTRERNPDLLWAVRGGTGYAAPSSSSTTTRSTAPGAAPGSPRTVLTAARARPCAPVRWRATSASVSARGPAMRRAAARRRASDASRPRATATSEPAARSRAARRRTSTPRRLSSRSRRGSPRSPLSLPSSSTTRWSICGARTSPPASAFSAAKPCWPLRVVVHDHDRNLLRPADQRCVR